MVHFVYLILFLCLWSGIDRRKLDLQTLDRLQPSARYLYDQYSNGGFDPKRLHQAIVYYKTLAKLFGSTPAEDNTLGYCFYLTHDYPRASFYFKRAAVSVKNSYAIFFNLGMSYYAQGLYGQSEEAFTNASRLLTVQEYFRPDILSPYRLAATTQEGDRKPLLFALAIWHCHQMMVLSQKAQNRSLTPQDRQLESQWKRELLKNQLFYWIPERHIQIVGGFKSTL